MVYELISFAIMYTTVPMLAYGIKTYDWEIFKIIILTILTLFSGYFATLIWNDITDKEIDKIAHPDRSIPAGRITPKKIFCNRVDIFSYGIYICDSYQCLVFICRRYGGFIRNIP
jgi:heme O synthase-like polyprenyltransferase